MNATQFFSAASTMLAEHQFLLLIVAGTVFIVASVAWLVMERRAYRARYRITG